MEYSGQHHWVKHPYYATQQPVPIPFSSSYSTNYLSSDMQQQHYCHLHSVPVAVPQPGSPTQLYHWSPTYSNGWPCHCSQAAPACAQQTRRYSTPSQVSPVNNAFHQFSASSSPRAMNFQDSPAQPSALNARVLQAQRGPPQKPVQTRHALWVGSIPPGTRILDLRDFFLQPDTVESIISIVHIPSSHSGFINFTSSAACQNAVHRFNGAPFRGSILNCRLRRPTVDTDLPSIGPTTHSRNTSGVITDMTPPGTPFAPPPGHSEQYVPESPESELCIVDSSGSNTNVDSTNASSTSDDPEYQGSTRYFILKSLTIQDLEASVKSGQWSTQMHNERGLNEAFEKSNEVLIVFSANKSREFFGYARMTSPIVHDTGGNSHEPETVTSKMEPSYTIPLSAFPNNIPTFATERKDHIPAGRIVDELARGKIFWEIDGAEFLVRNGQIGMDHNPNPGRFSLQWLSTKRVPFRFSSHLKNKLNRGQEVKVGRDGTELDPETGATLCALFDESRRLGLA